MFINRLGSHLIGLCRAEKETEIGAWNMESGAHQHIAKQKFYSAHGE